MARPPKRRASSTLSAKHRMPTAKPVYSTVEPTLEEKQLLPERFRKADEWPVTGIIDERGGKYLVEWEAHPNTGAIWKPEWRKAADVSDDLIARWRERKRKEKIRHKISAQSSSASKQSGKGWERDGASKRRRLIRHISSSGKSARTAAQDTFASESQQTRIPQKRQSRLVIRSSSSPSAEIQETQQQSLGTTDSIQVNVAQANHIDREEYQTIPDSSASLEFPESSRVAAVSPKDQEADSALGLSSPIGDNFRTASASFIDQEDQEPSENTGSHSNLSPSQIPASSAQSVGSQILREGLPAATERATTTLAQKSLPIEAKSSSIKSTEKGDPGHSITNTAASSPLFYPDRREELQETDSDAIHSVTPSQDLAQNQFVDTSAQQRDLGTVTSRTNNDSLPILLPPDRGQNAQSQRPDTSGFATPSPIVRHPSAYRSASRSRSIAGRDLGTKFQRSPPLTRESTESPRQAHVNPSARQLLRAKHFQHLKLSSSLQQPARLLAAMSSRSRESSPRVRRSAPPVERGASNSSLRETLMKQTAPARALQQARHERAANRSTSRATSTATDSTRNSIPARTGNTSPVHPQANLASTLHSDQAFNANGAFSSSMQVDDSEPALVSSIAPAMSVYNSALGSSALPLHPSIEDEQTLPQVTKPSLPSSPILGPGEYVVPLPAEGKIKDHYLECITSKRRTIMKFIRNPKSTGRANNSRINAEEAEEMRRLLNRLNDTTTHLDLGLDGPAMQYNDNNSMNEATWTYYASSKFAFLYHLIETLRYQDFCFAVIAKEGLTLDLLERYMKANHVNYRRPPGFDAASTYRIEGSTGLIRVDLIASGSDLERTLTWTPALIIAFDTSFDAQDAKVHQIRIRFGSDGTLIPIIYPMIVNSAEHVDICIPKSMPSPQRFQMVIQTTFRARDSLGGDPIIITSPPPPDIPGSMNVNAFVALKKSLAKRFTLIAEAVAGAAVSESFDGNWVIPPAMLELEPLSDPSSGLNTAGSTSPQSRAGTPSLQKRHLERDSASSISSKRQRRTPPTEATHISDSIKDSQSQIENLRVALRKADEKLSEENKARMTAEQLLEAKEKQLEEVKLSLGDLQTRYESRMKFSHQLKRDNQKLQLEKENIERRQEKLSADSLTLKEQLTQVRAELTEARGALKAGGGPVADLESAKEEVRRLTEKNLSLEKSTANMRKDFEFTRQQYQEASTRAAEFATQISELESQRTDLTRQASDEKRRLKELNYKTDLEQHLARVLELELNLKNRDTMLQRKEEELKAMKKARGITTRGSSVQPGSPRLTGSRGGSPAPGLLGPGTHVVNRASALRHER